MPESQIQLWPQILPALRQFLGQSLFKQRPPSLAPFEPMPCLVQCESASPWREWLARIIGIEFFPEHQCRLLHDVFRIRHIRDQCGDIAKNFALAAQKERKKSLLRRRRVFEMALFV